MYRRRRQTKTALAETRLFIEEICCDLLRFLHAADGRVDPHRVRIIQEYSLGPPGAYADIRIQPVDAAPYYVEVKYGYSPRRTIQSLTRKYGPTAAIMAEAGPSQIVVSNTYLPGASRAVPRSV